MLLSFIKTYLFNKPDEQRLAWLYPHNRKATLSGLAFVFLTFTALSLVDRCFFAAEYYSKLPVPARPPFEWDSCFRLVFVPIVNLGVIIYVLRFHRGSTKQLTNAASFVLLTTMCSLVITGVVQDYYSANDYTWEVVALIVFTMTMFGLPFRTSFWLSFVMMVSGIAFLVFDNVEQKVLAYNLTFLLAIWVAMIVGAYRKSELRRENFEALKLLRQSTIELDAKARELVLRNGELQQFAYASSHDLQEPLRTISNFASILEKRVGAQMTEEVKLYLGYITKSTERMKLLIKAILEHSHIGRNTKLAEVNLEALLRQVIADIDYAIVTSGAEIRYGKLPTIVCYEAEFSMLMQNLLGNAIKFKRQGVQPVVTVSVSEEEGEYLFSIADNGIGIEEKYLDKIFVLFGRLHSREEYEGTGIGLAHCKKIIELHGGKIWVESVPRNGTTFHFTISRNLKTAI